MSFSNCLYILIKVVISGGNWLFGWDYVFADGSFYPSANYDTNKGLQNGCFTREF